MLLQLRETKDASDRKKLVAEKRQPWTPELSRLGWRICEKEDKVLEQNSKGDQLYTSANRTVLINHQNGQRRVVALRHGNSVVVIITPKYQVIFNVQERLLKTFFLK